MQTKSFKTEVLLSIYTGKAMPSVAFDQVHEAVEWLIGESVWTHQLANAEIWRKAVEALLAQHDEIGLANDAELEAKLTDVVDGSERGRVCQEWLSAECTRLGPLFDVKRGIGRSEEAATVAMLAEIPEDLGRKSVVVIVHGGERPGSE